MVLLFEQFILLRVTYLDACCDVRYDVRLVFAPI
jgi:hypothetical protein